MVSADNSLVLCLEVFCFVTFWVFLVRCCGACVDPELMTCWYCIRSWWRLRRWWMPWIRTTTRNETISQQSCLMSDTNYNCTSLTLTWPLLVLIAIFLFFTYIENNFVYAHSCKHRGSTGLAEHFLRTTYLPIWLPMTCWSEMPHYCRVVIHVQKIVPRIFNNIKHTERSPNRISLFYYNTTYSLCTYNHRPSINTV